MNLTKRIMFRIAGLAFLLNSYTATASIQERVANTKKGLKSLSEADLINEGMKSSEIANDKLDLAYGWNAWNAWNAWRDWRDWRDWGNRWASQWGNY